MEKYKQPDFKQIYTDMIISKYPNKYGLCEYLLSKNELLALDILKLNTIIFGASEKNNSKYRSYKTTDILSILDYQKEHKLNNSQVALHFKLSRNTIAKWRKIFLV
ncbi:MULTISPECIES: helix-turn-helix domain-containing protein [unclassified Chryseobacterium]|uniref:helix-turn-helix domain-containing protein n=1 Tax=unclassified Chryseobacterium TaxID=2593645 RepID=UPI00100AED09|nr:MULTISPECIES: helix-turn-helix domain-containing protein [unclassified Chryseobacterium]RXM53183.1 transposase [Chryseobacterium sp. CH25]RXM65625.1 transposase [Chryseobacterium sp. CH1]